MNVQIKETGERKELNIIDWRSGVNWVNDLIGNTGALNDGQFTWSEDEDAYIVNQDTFDWWSQYISDSEKTNQEAQELSDELGIRLYDVMDRIAQNTGNDYEMHRGEAVAAMNELKEEYA